MVRLFGADLLNDHEVLLWANPGFPQYVCTRPRSSAVRRSRRSGSRSASGAARPDGKVGRCARRQIGPRELDATFGLSLPPGVDCCDWGQGGRLPRWSTDLCRICVTACGDGGEHRLPRWTESGVRCSAYSVSFSSVPLVALCWELVRSALIPWRCGVPGPQGRDCSSGSDFRG